MHTAHTSWLSSVVRLHALPLLALAALSGCGPTESEPDAVHVPSFEEYKAQARPTGDGRYVVEGDMALTEERLAAYYEQHVVPAYEAAQATGDEGSLRQREDGLTVDQLEVTVPGTCKTVTYCPPPPPCGPVVVCNPFCTTQWVCPPPPPCTTSLECTPPTIKRVDNIWDTTTRRRLTYCVANGEVGSTNKAKLVTALNTAAAAWEAAAGVDFIYVSSEDWRCNSSNTAVVFDVHVNFTPQFGAQAFFPSDSRAYRNIQVGYDTLVNQSASGLASIMAHELGHVLGLRHEHIRVNQSTASILCNESVGLARGVTAYDGASIMHYTFCNGALSGAGTLPLSSSDVSGIRQLYP